MAKRQQEGGGEEGEGRAARKTRNRWRRKEAEEEEKKKMMKKEEEEEEEEEKRQKKKEDKKKEKGGEEEEEEKTKTCWRKSREKVGRMWLGEWRGGLFWGGGEEGGWAVLVKVEVSALPDTPFRVEVVMVVSPWKNVSIPAPTSQIWQLCVHFMGKNTGVNYSQMVVRLSSRRKYGSRLQKRGARSCRM